MTKEIKQKGRGYRYDVTRAVITVWACERCGTEVRKTLLVHHKDSMPRNNNVENLQVLCAKCHAVIHGANRDRALKLRNELFAHKTALLKAEKEKLFRDTIFKALGTHKYYRAKDLTNLLGVSKERIRQVRGEGYLNYIKIKGGYYYGLPPLKPWYIYKRYLSVKKLNKA